MKTIRVALSFLLLSAVLFAAGCGKKMTEKMYYEKAKAYEQNEEFDKAAETYLGLYKRFPAGEYGDESLFRAAIILDNTLKQHKRAIETLRRLQRAFPNSEYVPQAQFMIGFIYANSLKDFDNARVEYEKFLAEFPKNELATSVKWELENMGKDINEIDFLVKNQADSTKAK